MDLSLHHVGLLVKEIKEAASLYLRLGFLQETEVIHDPTQTCLLYTSPPFAVPLVVA